MGPFLAKLWCLEDVLSKTWNLLRVHSQNLQSVVTPSKMTLFVDFSLKMEIYMLSFQIKQKLKENTQKQKNGIWLKWRRNRQKSTKIVPGPAGAFPGCEQVPFWSISPPLQPNAIFLFLGIFLQILF